MNDDHVSKILAVAQQNQIGLAITRIKKSNIDNHETRRQLVVFAIKHLEHLEDEPASEKSILEAIQHLHEASADENVFGFDSVFGIDPERLAQRLTPDKVVRRGSIRHIKNILNGGGVEGMIKRFDLNARASLEARSGTLTIGKLLELQPGVFIPGLN